MKEHVLSKDSFIVPNKDIRKHPYFWFCCSTYINKESCRDSPMNHFRNVEKSKKLLWRSLGALLWIIKFSHQSKEVINSIFNIKTLTSLQVSDASKRYTLISKNFWEVRECYQMNETNWKLFTIKISARFLRELKRIWKIIINLRNIMKKHSRKTKEMLLL